VAHDLRANLDQLLLEARQRPIFDRLRRRQRAQEVAEIIGEGMKLEPHRVGGERAAREPRPSDRSLALLDHCSQEFIMISEHRGCRVMQLEKN